MLQISWVESGTEANAVMHIAKLNSCSLELVPSNRHFSNTALLKHYKEIDSMTQKNTLYCLGKAGAPVTVVYIFFVYLKRTIVYFLLLSTQWKL